MVCVPCIVIPFFLFIWHKFLQPIFLRFWNPWGEAAAVEGTGGVDADAAAGGENKKKDEVSSAGDAVAGKKTCPIAAFSGKSKSGDDGTTATATLVENHPKID
jgi:hypothetical protein